ncbi:innexin inx2-like isoform X2 [Penaeus indicus]|uniref:innexin inx2-like isoform X2 n=1 Tax=Penaeus indicus TaxID=29960 RepID=UPI00300CC4BB
MSDVDQSLRQLLASYDSAAARPKQPQNQRERGMVMPGQGGRSFDIIRQIVGNVVNIFNKRASPCTAPCDGMVLKMHYQWTFWVLLGGFSAIWYSWYHRDVITCASHFNAETQVRLDYINICLSYPFVQGAGEDLDEGEGGQRRYLLFYRWIHWALLLLAGIYYIPRKISKTSENTKVKKLIEDLAVNAHRYDGLERELVDRTARYIAFNLKTHNGLYYKYLTCNLVALLVDIFCFQFLDFMFQGRFLRYGFQAYPFNRDPQQFTDYMSEMFPPFADCELHNEVQLTNKRIERLGCHLTVMELYEKVFLALWLWLIILTSITVGYIIFLSLMWVPWARLFMLRIAKPLSAKDTIRNTICNIVSSCKIGDVYLLYRLKQHFSHARYYELLTRLSDPDFLRTMLDSVSIDHHGKGGGGGGPDLRQRPNKNQKPAGPERWLS